MVFVPFGTVMYLAFGGSNCVSMGAPSMATGIHPLPIAMMPCACLSPSRRWSTSGKSKPSSGTMRSLTALNRPSSGDGVYVAPLPLGGNQNQLAFSPSPLSPGTLPQG
jgi:hypothetical protein